MYSINLFDNNVLYSKNNYYKNNFVIDYNSSYHIHCDMYKLYNNNFLI